MKQEIIRLRKEHAELKEEEFARTEDLHNSKEYKELEKLRKKILINTREQHRLEREFFGA